MRSAASPSAVIPASCTSHWAYPHAYRRAGCLPTAARRRATAFSSACQSVRVAVLRAPPPLGERPWIRGEHVHGAQETSITALIVCEFNEASKTAVFGRVIRSESLYTAVGVGNSTAVAVGVLYGPQRKRLASTVVFCECNEPSRQILGVVGSHCLLATNDEDHADLI